MIACRFASPAGQFHALVVGTSLRRTAITVGNTAIGAGFPNASMVHRLVACSASNRLTAVAFAFFGAAALVVRRTASRNRRAFVIACRFASPAGQRQTEIV